MEMQHWKKIDYFRNNLHLCRNGKKLSEMIPKNWCKFGEVYVTNKSEMFLLCSVCVEYAEHFRQAFYTADAFEFQEHLRKRHSIDVLTPCPRNTGSAKRNTSLKVVEQFLPNSKLIIGPEPVASSSIALKAINEASEGNDVIEIRSSSGEVALNKVESTCRATASKRERKRGAAKGALKGKRDCPTKRAKRNSCHSSNEQNSIITLNCAENLCDSIVKVCDSLKEEHKEQWNPVKNRKVSDRPYKCNICGKRTLSVEALTAHKSRFHSTTRDSGTVACEICQKVVLRSNIHQHRLVHTDLRFYCPFCNNSYKQKQTLTLHIKRLHNCNGDALTIFPKANNTNDYKATILGPRLIV